MKSDKTNRERKREKGRQKLDKLIGCNVQVYYVLYYIEYVIIKVCFNKSLH